MVLLKEGFQLGCSFHNSIISFNVLGVDRQTIYYGQYNLEVWIYINKLRVLWFRQGHMSSQKLIKHWQSSSAKLRVNEELRKPELGKEDHSVSSVWCDAF